MKIIKDEIATLKRRRRITVEVDHNEQLMAFKDDCHYELGDPLDMIVAGHFLNNSQRVYWCSVTQGWMI